MVGLSSEFKFRDVFNQRVITGLGERLQATDRDFDAAAFVREASADLDDLGMAERSGQIAEALQRHLPGSFSQQVGTLVDALPPPLPETGETDWDAFIVMPQCEWVSRHGQGHWNLAMNALYQLTQRLSAEGQLRTFIELDFPKSMKVLKLWARDPSAHVRRLVSEGTRPRLPLAGRIRRFVADPTPVLQLLELLRDDPNLYVRRSVANNLNDIAKDNAEHALDTLESWSEGASPERQWMIRHAARTLLKQGHPRAIALFGFTADPELNVQLTLEARWVEAGTELCFAAEIRSTAKIEQRLMLDYVVHFVKKSGKLAPKVFKWTERTIAPGETLQLERRQHLRDTSGRKIHLGDHRVALKINGIEHEALPFRVTRG